MGAQEALAQASVGTNKATINLIKSANGATVSTEALTAAQKASTVASKALSLGMKALSVAMNVGIALLIPIIIKGIDKLITTKAELAKKAEEVTSKFREQKEELTGNRAKFDELAVKYEKLSKGVNALGENLSLTSDEYEEYHNVVNQIASMFPSWVKGWDEQGNITDTQTQKINSEEFFWTTIKDNFSDFWNLSNGGGDVYALKGDVLEDDIYGNIIARDEISKHILDIMNDSAHSFIEVNGLGQEYVKLSGFKEDQIE